MKVIIVNNKVYNEWVYGNGNEIHPLGYKPHYSPGEIYEVIGYRYNPHGYYEAVLETLSDEKKKICPTMSGGPCFWIDKLMTELYEEKFDLPEELFKI
jgi:hypothetical protein